MCEKPGNYKFTGVVKVIPGTYSLEDKVLKNGGAKKILTVQVSDQNRTSVSFVEWEPAEEITNMLEKGTQCGIFGVGMHIFVDSSLNVSLRIGTGWVKMFEWDE